MIKLVCSVCGEDWREVGNAYNRTVGQRIDYYCSNCQTKRKPKRVESTYESFIDFGTFSANLSKGHTTDPENVLVIGDIHEPFCLEGYREFCLSIYQKHRCSHVVFMGDIIDQHHPSFHATDPDGLGGGDELDFAIHKIQAWAKLFPNADVCLGNHDKIILRKAFNSGISKRWIKDFKDVLGVNWNFQPSHILNGVLFRHGMGMKASPKSGSEMMNVVQGHFHTEANITYKVGSGKMIFGMQCPCGIDRKAYAMAYAEEHPKEAIGVGVIKEYGRLPIIEMMEL